MTRTSKETIVAATSVLAAALIGAIDCGGVSTDDLQSARTQATTASCNYYQMCNQIGPGLTFETFQDCQNQALSFWTSQWPTAACDGKIVSSALSMCIDAINSTLCMNGIDVLATLYAKCPEARICGLGDAGAD
jgi:uncharacterized protein DUF6184